MIHDGHAPLLALLWLTPLRISPTFVAQHISLASSGGWDLAKGVRTSGPLHYLSY
jgi:hypothetical protein